MKKVLPTLLITAIFLVSFFMHGCLDIVIPELPTEPDADFSGTVSGTVTDAQTTNPIPGIVVSLLDLEVKTDADGIFTFHDVPYTEEQELNFLDPDYQNHTHTFTLDQELLVLKIDLTPLNNPEEELNAFLENFSELVASLDLNNLPRIQSLFSETYVASDDPTTVFGIISGVVPTNYENIIPTFSNEFEVYSWLQFAFKDRMMDITHARKASIELLLIVDAEKAEDNTERHLKAKCVINFHRENSYWKIVYWKLLSLDILL